MKKKMLIMTVLAALLAVPVFAATTDQVNPQNQCNPMNASHQQMIQQAVNDGTISSEEAATLNESMQKIAPTMQKVMKSHGMVGNGMMHNKGMMRNGGMMQNGYNNGTDQAKPQNQWGPMNAKHQQMIQQAVNAGTITSEEAATLNESLEKTAPIMQKIMKNHGMMQNGGMMKHGGMMQNCSNNNGQNNNTQSNNQ